MIEPIIIRPIADPDYEPLAALAAPPGADPNARARAWRQVDARADPQRRTARYVAVEQATRQLVGYVAFWWVRLQKYRLDLQIAPSWRRRGVGGRLMLRALDELALRGAASVQARTSEEDLESLTFLWRHGFVETQRMYHLALDVPSVDLAPWRGLERRLVMQGVSITSLAYERAHDPAAPRKLYDLHIAVLPDLPDPDPAPATTITFENYFRRFEQDAIVPDGFFIAKRGGQYIGYSGLLELADEPGRLYSTGTAVRPEARRQGLATALIVRTVAYAQSRGCPQLLSNTASPPLLALSLRLGFRRERAEVRLVREL
jgi:GNAT superfamily N-acetyltransferase